jgi:murein DD-endopeptidase MepM/ murein hydrolase activator NlpD
MSKNQTINQKNDLDSNNLDDYNFIRPVPLGLKITQLFGERPEVYAPMGFLGHSGIDWGCRVGTDVYCSNWGWVLEIGNNPKGYGKYIKIQHKKLITLYAHLSYVGVEANCYITRGQCIAKSGNTGFSTGPHLHFEVIDPTKYDNGYKGRLDPMLYLANTEAGLRDQLTKIHAEIAQIQKDGYKADSLFVHVKYIEKILSNQN